MGRVIFGGMSQLRRVIVGLKSQENSDIVVPAKFVDCIVDFFAQEELSVRVACKLQDNMLVLQPLSHTDKVNNVTSNVDSNVLGNSLNFSSVVLQHSPECPVKNLEDVNELPEKLLDQGVYVGVAVILESSDKKILLTQRADHMRAFPRVWVPPGGHLEFGESLVEGAFRELQEETGLIFDVNTSNIQLMCLWESVYPVLLGFGVPKNHHVVAYIHLKANDTWEQLQENIELDPEEVQACTWLDEANVISLFEGRNFGIVTKFMSQPNGIMKRVDLNLSNMFPRTLWQEYKIYSGTQLALHHWLMLCQKQCKM